MNSKLSKKSPQRKLRWSAALLLAGYLLGSLLPSLGKKVQAAPHQAVALDVVINEIAWGGTLDYSGDEWIELYNSTSSSIDITGWTLFADGGGLNIILAGSIPADGYFLLERTNDDTISDITADQIYPFTGNALDNTNEILHLLDTLSTEIDTANIDGGGAWLAGSGSPDYISMERIAITADSATVWVDNNGITFNGLDGNIPPNPIRGTPKQPNSVSYAPLSIIINEVAWAGTIASSDDEWIELHNPNSWAIDLTDWRLVAESGNLDFILNGPIAANGYFLLERTHDNVVSDITADQIYTLGALNDSGEKLRLRAPNGEIIDTANGDGGAWSHGHLSPASSMERMSTSADADDNWVTNIGTNANGKDAAGNNIYGSPRQENLWGYYVTYTPTNTATSTATSTPTNTATSTATNTSTATQTFTPTTTNTPTSTATAPASLTVLINEVGWGGTAASSTDEWIELYNSSDFTVDFNSGWKLISTDGGIDIHLTGTLADGEYYLLERTDNDTVSDIAADLIYSGSLSNDGEYLKLLAPDGSVVDTANNDGGSWPAGNASPDFASMERSGTIADSSSAWFTFDGGIKNGEDAEGNPINGTPKQANWAISVTATPSPVPTVTPIVPTSTPTPFPHQSIVLNEVLARPGHDWNRDGIINANDEFIEIINRGNSAVNLQGWKLDDEYNSGSSPYTLPNVNLAAGERIAIFGYTSRIALSDGGDTVRLLKSNSQIADVVTYTIAKVADQSWCRFPENGFWNPKCFPTPDEENALHGESNNDLPALPRTACLVPDTVPEIIYLIECGSLGMSIYDADFWQPDFSTTQLTGHAKYSTWFR